MTLAGDPDATAVAAAALACPGVARLWPGAYGEVATYLPGRRVHGVRVVPGRVEVHVVAVHGPPVHRIADEVRTAVQPLAHPSVVDVVIADLDVPGWPDERDALLTPARVAPARVAPALVTPARVAPARVAPARTGPLSDIAPAPSLSVRGEPTAGDGPP